MRPTSIPSLSSTPSSAAPGCCSSSRRAVSPVPVPNSRIFRAPLPLARTSSDWRRSKQRHVHSNHSMYVPGLKCHCPPSAVCSSLLSEPHRGGSRATTPRPRSGEGRPPSRTSPAARLRRSPGPPTRESARARRPIGAGPVPPQGSRSTGAPSGLTPASRSTAGTRTPSVPRSCPHASGNRLGGIRQQQRHAAGQQSRNRPTRGARRARAALAGRPQGEEHHRRRLLERAPLERVEPLDRTAVVRGRTRAHTRCPPGTARRRRPRCSARRPRRRSPLPDHHTLVPGQVP